MCFDEGEGRMTTMDWGHFFHIKLFPFKERGEVSSCAIAPGEMYSPFSSRRWAQKLTVGI